MGFGLRDADWVDPDNDPHELLPCYTCSRMDWNPDGGVWCYCMENHEWTKADWVQGCSDGEGDDGGSR